MLNGTWFYSAKPCDDGLDIIDCNKGFVPTRIVSNSFIFSTMSEQNRQNRYNFQNMINKFAFMYFWQYFLKKNGYNVSFFVISILSFLQKERGEKQIMKKGPGISYIINTKI